MASAKCRSSVGSDESGQADDSSTGNSERQMLVRLPTNSGRGDLACVRLILPCTRLPLRLYRNLFSCGTGLNCDHDGPTVNLEAAMTVEISEELRTHCQN